MFLTSLPDVLEFFAGPISTILPTEGLWIIHFRVIQEIPLKPAVWFQLDSSLITKVPWEFDEGVFGGSDVVEIGGVASSHGRPFVGLSQPRSASFLEPFCGKMLSKVDKPD